ncbi:hypothetical protein U9M48_044490 [Paspalum notatum var. saurae]|uniref:Uncharacterized protein n=1 Tax=Paspalum notatum var. saurae TaxID=547442 RepID=A0AAQ3UVR9_PASNO
MAIAAGPARSSCSSVSMHALVLADLEAEKGLSPHNPPSASALKVVPMSNLTKQSKEGGLLERGRRHRFEIDVSLGTS